MALTQLTEGGYVVNHWITILWCSAACVYTYLNCIIDMISAIHKKFGSH